MHDKTTILLDVEVLFGRRPRSESNNGLSEASIPPRISRRFPKSQMPILLAAVAQGREELKVRAARGRFSRTLVWKNALEILGARFDPVLFDSEHEAKKVRPPKPSQRILGFLRKLRAAGMKVGIISSRPLADEILRLRFPGAADLCDFVVTSDEAYEAAPPIVLLELALHKAHATPQQALLVTESLDYIQAAASIDLHTVSLSAGKRRARGITYQVSNPSAILSLTGAGHAQAHARKKPLVAFDLMGTIFEQSSFCRQVLWPLIHRRDPNLSFEEAERLYLDYSLGRLSDNHVRRKLGVHLVSQALGGLRVRRDAVKTMRALRKRGYVIAIISNIPEKWGRDILKLHGLERYVDVVIFSGTHHSRKPDERLYRILLRKSHAFPATSYLVDDKLTNLRAARFLNIKTVFMRTEPKYVLFLPDYTISRLSQILRIVRSLSRVST